MIGKVIVLGLIIVIAITSWMYISPYVSTQSVPVNVPEKFDINNFQTNASITSVYTKPLPVNITHVDIPKPIIQFKDKVKIWIHDNNQTFIDSLQQRYTDIRDRYYNSLFKLYPLRINSSNIQTCVPILDNVSPFTNVTISGIHGLNGWYVQAPVITLFSIDDCSGVKELLVHDTHQNWEIHSPLLNIVTEDRLKLSYPKGSYRIWYKAIDYNNNIEPEKVLTVFVDSVKPDIDYVGIPNIWRIHEGIHNMTLYVQDYSSGIEKLLLKPCSKFALCQWIQFNGTQDDKYSMVHSMYVAYTQYWHKGVYTVELLAVDHAGNTNERDIQVLVDFTPKE